MKFRFREGLFLKCDEDLNGDSVFTGENQMAGRFKMASVVNSLYASGRNYFNALLGNHLDGGLRVDGCLPGDLTTDIDTSYDTGTRGQVSVFSEGHIYTKGKVFNAVYNDIAEFRKLADGYKLEYGKCYVQTRYGIRPSQHYLESGCIGICSDTFGYSLGSPIDGNAPIALCGWVLAKIHSYEDLKIGTCLTAGANGILYVMSPEVIQSNPDKIVARYMGDPENDSLRVQCLDEISDLEGRYWVKI